MLAAALAGALSLAPGLLHAAMPVTLTCTLTGPAQLAVGQPARFEWSLANSGAHAVDVLVWATPFEPVWFAPYVTVRRGDAPVPYRGAKVKRGDPQASDYLHLAAGQTRRASFALAPAFDLGTPGRYRVQPQIVLHDVVVDGSAQVPRPRDRHAGVALDCNGVDVEVG